MADDAPFLPGLSPVAGKPVHISFDAGRLTSDGGVLVLAEIERKLGLAERLACCLDDPRAPERVIKPWGGGRVLRSSISRERSPPDGQRSGGLRSVLAMGNADPMPALYQIVSRERDGAQVTHIERSSDRRTCRFATSGFR
jgi:DDE family transposase